ncbi:MAG: deoxyhypusine synthase [Candidatus Altiarchaeales archaeon IMC4]|nr:MAG: deoxyhypusine synthase [Candidatus Altiarchaeales archaeon IMC4]
MKSVKDIDVSKVEGVDNLVRQMSASGGFTAKKLAAGVDILEDMAKDGGSVNFLSFPACIISTGTRGVIKELVKRKVFDVIITTCGTLDHDLARIWKDYYHGDFQMDDAALHKKGINRLGNILIPNECYGEILENKMQEMLADICRGKERFATYEIIGEFGRRIKDKDSILYWASKNEIPIIVPGITDGAFGSQLFFYAQDHKLDIDVFADEKLLADITFDAKKSGALMIGGGISKHHTIWWNQFRGGLDRAVYITTAPEYDGSLSGARIREAVSWGKVKENAKYITVEGDATVLLPVMISALLERLG